jgi:hypothetical protein
MTPRTSRRSLLAAAGTVALAGCLGVNLGQSGGGSSAGTTTGTPDPTTSEPSTGTPNGDPPGDVLPLADGRLPVQYEYAQITDEIVSGGPPKDGIPSVDEPTFESAEAASQWLDDGDVVFGVAAGGEARAYPQRVLVWHEIVNDVLPALPGGDGRTDVPVSVSYCPLTGTTIGYERGSTTFGVSGKLVNSNLVMYDRATDSRWPQVLGTAVSGTFQGRSLREFPLTWARWGDWKAAYPETSVMSRETGFVRDYTRDPYGNYNPPSGYYANANTLFPPLTRDDRLGAKAVVVGVRTPEGVAAFHKETLADAGTLSGRVGEVPYLAVFDPELAAAIVYRNPDRVAFEATGDGQVAGPDGTYAPDAVPLARTPAFDAMWFAWAGFYPETSLYGGGGQ